MGAFRKSRNLNLFDSAAEELYRGFTYNHPQATRGSFTSKRVATLETARRPHTVETQEPPGRQLSHRAWTA
jgi:hypothetical protein